MFAKAVVLSHKEQVDRLATETPQALDRAVVAGDPCFDRMRVSTHRRAAYREALGVPDDRTVVVVSSTWRRGSLFGRHPDLISQLLAELTLDHHVVAAILHPNVWVGHGPAQLRAWLGDALRSGLRLVPPLHGWQQAVLAADTVIGDHGAVTGYAAACGIPTLLATFPPAEVAPGSVIDALGQRATRLDHHRPYQPQVHDAIAHHDPGVAAQLADLTSSAPDRAADLLRATFYRMLDLSEPDHPPLVNPYRAADLRPERDQVRAVWADCAWRGGVAHLRRWPAEVTARRGMGPRAGTPYLVVHHDQPRRDLAGNAAVVLADDWAHVFRTRAACQLVASATADGCVLRRRDGTEAHLRTTEPAVVAAAVQNGDLRTLPQDLTIKVGSRTVTARRASP